MNKYLFSLSLRIRHRSRSAADICAEIGLSPEFSWSAGDPRKTPKGTPLDGFRKETYCSFSIAHLEESGLENIDLENCIHQLNRKMSNHRKFLDDIVDTGGSIEYFVGIFHDRNIGITMSSSLMKELTAMNISLALDIYPGALDEIR